MTTTPAPTDIDLDALKALEQAATPAPWKADTETRGDCVLWGPDGQFVANAQAEPHWLPAADGGKRAVMFDVDRRDVALIEAMRNALPALLDELAEARAQMARVSAFCQGVLSEAIAPTEYQAVMAQEVLSRLANPATTAEPATQHGPSAHGRACCDQLPAHMLPTTAADCGGVKACDLCREWADEIHGAGTAEPADEPKATCGSQYWGGLRVPYCLVHGEKPAAS